jgi:hypothetical protein
MDMEEWDKGLTEEQAEASRIPDTLFPITRRRGCGRPLRGDPRMRSVPRKCEWCDPLKDKTPGRHQPLVVLIASLWY